MFLHTLFYKCTEVTEGILVIHEARGIGSTVGMLLASDSDRLINDGEISNGDSMEWKARWRASSIIPPASMFCNYVKTLVLP